MNAVPNRADPNELILADRAMGRTLVLYFDPTTERCNFHATVWKSGTGSYFTRQRLAFACGDAFRFVNETLGGPRVRVGNASFNLSVDEFVRATLWAEALPSDAQ